MKHEHQPTFAFPSDLSDREAITLCDFLFQLAADADARYLVQILRYRYKNNRTPRHPDLRWESESDDF